MVEQTAVRTNTDMEGEHSKYKNTWWWREERVRSKLSIHRRDKRQDVPNGSELQQLQTVMM